MRLFRFFFFRAPQTRMADLRGDPLAATVCLVPALALRCAALVSKTWHTAVEAERSRSLVYNVRDGLLSPDGMRLLAVGGYVGYSECQICGDNAYAAVDEYFWQTDAWVPRASLAHKMIDPVMVHPFGDDASDGGTLAFWRGEGDLVFSEGVLALREGAEVCVSTLTSTDYAPITAVRVSHDIILAVRATDEALHVCACRPCGAWVPAGRIVTHLQPE